jgi:hypothetical protein
LVGCGDGGFDRLLGELYLGNPIPSSRLTVELRTLKTRHELYEAFERLAVENGYLYYFGTNVDERIFRESGIPLVFGWKIERQGEAWQVPSIEFSWDYESDVPTTIYLKLEASSEKRHLGSLEWLEFEKWRTDILPAAFPDASILVAQHPAEFTDFNELEQIAQETGISIPEEVWETYEAWILSERNDL